MKTKIKEEYLVSLPDIKLPMAKTYKAVDYDAEIELVDGQSSRFVKKKKTIENLEWLAANKIPLFYRPGNKKNFIYMFECDKKAHEFSACSLKVRFQGNIKWTKFREEAKMVEVLTNKRLSEIEKEMSEGLFVDFEIKEAEFGERFVTEKQFEFICSLLRDNRYEFEYELLDSISIDDAKRLIELLIAFKPIVFIYNKEKFIEDEDMFLDRILFFEKRNKEK